jgi:hypothetical protein
MENYLVVLVYRGLGVLKDAKIEKIEELLLHEFGDTVCIRDAGDNISSFKELLDICCHTATRETGTKLLVISPYGEYDTPKNMVHAPFLAKEARQKFLKLPFYWAVVGLPYDLSPESLIDFNLDLTEKDLEINLDEFLAKGIKLIYKKIF